MSATNAPQPDTAANAPAEIFDSTITVSSGQVSQDQGQGATSAEGPIHAGQLNTIDAYFRIQFMALTSFVWDISMNPGQLIWSIPIHPQFIHQYMGHLAEMYNAYVGGFDAAFTIAGTGFHCGKLAIVRLPPNVRPESLLTMADITAFPYFILDPKALETVVKSAMDQRNIMYHYLPYKADDPSSFGGYLAVYVCLPLNTSATGASQISVQVFSRPSQEFMFTQIVPLKKNVVNLWKPEAIVDALDFRRNKTHSLFLTDVTGMKIYAAKDTRFLDYQTLNAVKFDRTAMNGSLQERFAQQPVITSDRFPVGEFITHRYEVSRSDQGKKELYFATGKDGDDTGIFSFSGIKVSNDPTRIDKIPQFLCKNCVIKFRLDPAKNECGNDLSIAGELRKKDSSDTDTGLFDYVFKSTRNTVTNFDTGTTVDANFADELMKRNQIVELEFTFLEPLTYDINYTEYAPPIKESLLTFDTESGECAQPWELREAIMSMNLDETYKEKDSLIFELIDSEVTLPLMPVRLHYNGYFSTLSVTTDIVYKFTEPKRYYFRYVGTIPETTPMVGGRLPTQTPATYRANCVTSMLYNRHFNN